MTPNASHLSRRDFLGSSALLLLAASMPGGAVDTGNLEPIIDIHQHTNYGFRTNEQLIAHQRALGVARTVLQPAGRIYGLEASCRGNQSVFDLAKEHPKEFVFFANEVADIEEAREEIEACLKRGAIGIGEQKFRVECDSKYFERIAEIAREFDVPILMHFQHGTYNTGIERFHKILEKYPGVNFIGHAQTWWGNIDKNLDQTVLYPKGPVTPGGITDRLLSDYPNMYGDHSAGSGLNALTRDEEHARGFLQRHQDKLMFGSDCDDHVGFAPLCSGADSIIMIKRLSATKEIERKLLYGNAKKMFGI